VYLLTIINASAVFLEDLDKLRKRFLWAGDQALSGGKCKVNRPTFGRPLQLGGLVVLDLKSFARALRVRWLWQEQNEPDKHWAGFGTPCTETDKLLFAACTTTRIGDGSSISFWHSAWAKGRRPKDIATSIFNASRKKNRSLRDVLHDHAWVKDLNLSACLTVGHLQQFIALWTDVQEVRLQ
jgi:hypothetical protein